MTRSAATVLEQDGNKLLGLGLIDPPQEDIRQRPLSRVGSR